MDKYETYQHLLNRGLAPHFYNLSVGEGIVVFPLYDFGGKQVGYQNYRPFAERNHKNVKEARYFTYLPKAVNGYFGTETLKWPGPVYLVEGVFKAAKLHSLGHAAISMMGSETKQHRTQLRLLRREYIGIGDPDAAGEKFARALNGFTSPLDLDEMSDEAVEELLNEDYKERQFARARRFQGYVRPLQDSN